LGEAAMLRRCWPALEVGENAKATYNKVDLPTGLWPINVAVSPDAKIALTADLGAATTSDGSVDTISVVDLEAKPPRIIDRVVVGDGPEGLAISPKGDVAVVNGTDIVDTGKRFKVPGHPASARISAR